MGDVLHFPPQLRAVKSDNLKGASPIGMLGPFGDECPRTPGGPFGGELLQFPAKAGGGSAAREAAAPSAGGSAAAGAAPPAGEGEGSARRARSLRARLAEEGCTAVYHFINLLIALGEMLHLVLSQSFLTTRPRLRGAALRGMQYRREKQCKVS
jgi:hypothetical protein